MTHARIRLAFAGTCLAALAVPILPAAAHPTASVPHAVPLTATTLIQTAGSGTTEVFLAGSATLSGLVEQNPDVVLSGRGRLVGVWLEPIGDTQGFLSSYRLPAFAGGQQLTYGSRARTDCRPDPGALPLTAECQAAAPEEPLELGRGMYRLTVLADGAPLQVSLHLDGLEDDGSRSLPLRPLASTQQSLPVRETVSDRLVTFGDSADIGGPAHTFVVFAAQPSEGEPAPAVVQEASTCQRAESEAPPVAYGPHCPGGTAGSYSYSAHVGALDTAGAGAFASSSTEEATGPIGLGGSVGDTRGVDFGEALGAWLALP